MAWQSNGGGDRPNPWGSGGGNGSGGDGRRRGPSGGGSGGNGGEPPNIDEMIRQSQDKLKTVLPGGRGGIVLILIVLGALWAATGIFKVESNEEAVVLQFGKFSRSAGAGLHWHLPFPIETSEIRAVTQENTEEIGVPILRSSRGRSIPSNRNESLMLTGDENIVDLKFNVVWRISSLSDFLFNLSEPERTVKSVAESVMRELVGKNAITPIITTARGQLESDAKARIQEVLDQYGAGVSIRRVQIQESQAPDQVREAFREVQDAEAQKQTLQNQALAYQARVVPEAEGQAQRILEEANGYAAAVVAKAEGEASRFSAVYAEYRQARSVTRKRIYLETMEEILAGMDKIILDGQGGSGVVPYLPLNEINKGKNKQNGENDDE